MKAHLLREHTIQSVFALLDSALIIGGSLMTAALMKARGSGVGTIIQAVD